MSIDKTKLAKMMAEMAAVGAKYGYNVYPNGGTLGAADAKIKFLVKETMVDGDGKIKIAVSEMAKQYASFESIDISSPFTVRGKTHRVVDYRTRRGVKSPWVTETTEGQTFHWPTIALKQAIAPAAKKPSVDGLAHLIG